MFDNQGRESKAKSMLFRILLLFTLVPFIELALLIKLGEMIRFWPTIALVLITGVIGAALARAQGLRIWWRIQNELQQGRLPGDSMIEGLIILVGGALLVTPGILTDVIGILTLLPPSRAWIRERLKGRFKSSFHIQGSNVGGMPRMNDQTEVRDTDDWENL